MVTNEQIEAWTAEAADALERKIGPNACVIIMTMNVTENAPWAVEYRGGSLFIVFLERTGAKVIERKLLPDGTRG